MDWSGKAFSIDGLLVLIDWQAGIGVRGTDTSFSFVDLTELPRLNLRGDSRS